MNYNTVVMYNVELSDRIVIKAYEYNMKDKDVILDHRNRNGEDTVIR